MNIHWARAAPSSPPASAADGSSLRVSVTLDDLYRSEGPVTALRRAWPRLCHGSFEVLNILYVPDRSFRIVGRFAGPSAAAEDTVIALDFGADSHTRHAEALHRAAAPERIAHLPEWQAVARLFPEDPGLPRLAAMLDLPAVAARLGSRLGAGARWRLLSYQPGKRATLRYRLGEGDATYVGKLQADDAAIRCHRRLRELWHHPGRRFRMARPLAGCSRLGARWETFEAGTGLQQVCGETVPERALAAILASLANLHRLTVSDLPPLQPETVLARIQRKLLRRLRATLPEQAERATELCRQLQERLPAAAAAATLHGDFHIANLLMDGNQPVLLDLDDMRAGDPCYDLALFATRLLLVRLHRGDAPAGGMELAQQIADLYRQQGGRPLEPGHYAWYLAALLLGRQVKSCIRDDAPDRDVLVERLLDCATTLLHQRRAAGAET